MNGQAQVTFARRARDRRAPAPRRGRAPRAQLEALGALPRRAPVGHRARGLLGRRRRAGTTSRTTTRARRAYRWGEDGLLGHLRPRSAGCASRWRCGTARDPILKERLFGLTGPEGNHGEDVKECYYYLDSTPTHSYMKALYKYPQARVSLRRSWSRRTAAAARDEPEFELRRHRRLRRRTATSTCIVEYAKAAPDDILIRITVANRGPEPAHAAPAAARSGSATPGRGAASTRAATRKPRIERDRRRRGRCATHATLGRFRLAADAADGSRRSCCSPRTRPTRSGSSARTNRTPYVKDAFHEYVVARATRTR